MDSCTKRGRTDKKEIKAMASTILQIWLDVAHRSFLRKRDKVGEQIQPIY